MKPTLASAITRAASKQAYYTIRFLVDRKRIDEAYRAYGYFRWVDDFLDDDSGSQSERRAFLKRQKSLLEACYRGEWSRDLNAQENMLAELIQTDQEKNSGLKTYLCNMMRVMEFDAGRRGRLISQAELDTYTHDLASAVTEGMHYFIGTGEDAPNEEARYLAASGAHIAHMLRDAYDDVKAGYFNIPREVLEANRIGPQDTHSTAYRSWVKSRVQLARECFKAGRVHIRRVRNWRYRLAGCAYMARFEWLLMAIEQEGFTLRPQYHERKSIGTGLRMGWLTFLSMITWPKGGTFSGPIVPQRRGRP